MRLLGYSVEFLGAAIEPRAMYVGVYSAPSKYVFDGRWIAVSPIPFVSLRFVVRRTPTTYTGSGGRPHDPVTDWISGENWGDK